MAFQRLAQLRSRRALKTARHQVTRVRVLQLGRAGRCSCCGRVVADLFHHQRFLGCRHAERLAA